MMRRVMFVIALLALGSGVARGGDPPNEAAKDLQGRWQAAELDVNGMRAPEEDARAFRMTVKGDEIFLMTCKGDRCIERRKRFRLDPAKSPMEIDLIALDGREKGLTQPCILSIEKGRLRLCAPLFANGSERRPAEFKTRAGDGLMVVLLERIKAE